MEPLVSVIIPTFNGRRYLRETLESVFAQTYRALEVIVVDDGSTDSTAAVVAAFGSRVAFIRQERSGHPAARNRGVRASAGEFLSFLDHDDLWAPAKTASQMECFREDPQLDLVFGHIQNFFSPELKEEEKTRLSVPLHPLPGLLQGAMLARRTSFLAVGAFSEEREMGDFLDWYGRAMILNSKSHMQPDTVLRRRIHASNYQRTHGHLRQQYLPALKKLLDRRRAAGRTVKDLIKGSHR
jgi:glycosyltransferase involved in cell wall biosynthesis